MSKDLHQLFQNDSVTEISPDFTAVTISKIQTEADKMAKYRKIVWGTFSVLSLFAVIFAGRYAVTTFGQSGFGTYFSLLFSDSGSVFTSFKDFGLLLIESLPFIGLALFLGSIGTLFLSTKKLFKNSSTLPTLRHVA